MFYGMFTSLLLGFLPLVCGMLSNPDHRNQGVYKSEDSKPIPSSQESPWNRELRRILHRRNCHNDEDCKSERRELNKQTTERQIMADCPPGLWCKGKRQLGYESRKTIQDCPPGLWCRKKRNRAQNDHAGTLPQKTRCPYGFWCIRKRTIGYQSHETLPECPPQLWCRRKAINPAATAQPCSGPQLSSKTERKGEEFNGNGKEEDKRKDYPNFECPPGYYWCKKEVLGNMHKTRSVKKLFADLLKKQER